VQSFANHIKDLLSKRGLNIPRKKLTLPDNQDWVVFEREGKPHPVCGPDHQSSMTGGVSAFPVPFLAPSKR
jgi:hypothetical protein